MKVKIRPEKFRPLRDLKPLDLRDTGAEVIAEVMGSNPVQTQIFFRPYFRYCSSSVYYCEDHFHIHAFIYSSNI